MIWGDLELEVHELRGLRHVVANQTQVAVVCEKGLVLLPEQQWHEPVELLCPTAGGFWGLREGHVVSFGFAEVDCRAVALATTCGACAALLADGQVVAWGDARHGGDASQVQVGGA